MSDADNGNVLRVTKASPNVHLDWSQDGASGPFVLKRSLSFTFSNPVYLGPGQTTKTFDDGVLNNTTSYAYEAFRRTLTDTLYFYHADHLGTPIAMTDTSGALAWRAEHTPFGGIYALTAGTSTNNLRFPGQYYDSETGLAQNWNREFSSATGRYVEPDPFVFAHRYLREPLFLYGLNNPLTNRDPLGLVRCAYYIKAKTLCCVSDSGTASWCAEAKAGQGACQDNPCIPCQMKHDEGPLPEGSYYISPPKAGSKRSPLKPKPGTCMYGRDGFQIHGWGVSKGCIAIHNNSDRDILTQMITADNGGTLDVYP
jgi:RHS repeat-associated protein